MKRFFIISFLFCSLTSSGQFAVTQYVGNYNVTVNTTAELRQVTGRDKSTANRLGYYTNGDGGAAMFIYSDTSTLPDDSGKVIKPTAAGSTGRWIMQIGRVVSMKQFGAKADGVTDDRSVFNKAKNAASSIVLFDGTGNFVSKGVLKFNGGNYFFADSLLIDKFIELTGEPSGGYLFQESQLTFAPNKKGLVFRRNVDGSGNHSPIISNLLIKSQGGSDTTAHGLTTNGAIHARNICVYFFGGNGFNVETGLDGNANNFKFESCIAYYNLNGFFFHGNESNNGVLLNCDATGSARCNFRDDSFLGNSYYGCHTSATGGKFGQKSIVYHFPDSTIYTAIRNNINVEPGVTSGWQTYWKLSGQKSGLNAFHIRWNDTTYYYMSASYAVTGAAAASNFYGCYQEGEGSGPILSQFSTWWGGILGDAPVDNDMLWITGNAFRLQMRSGAGFRVIGDSSTSYSALERTFGLELGTTKAGYGNFQAKYFETDRYTKFFGGNSTGNLSFKFTGEGIDAGGFGRTGTIRVGYPIASQDGLFFTSIQNGALMRNVSMGSAAPASGSRGTGDFVINTGSDTSIIAWKCISGGTPGTWIAIKSGNAPVVNYTPTGTNDASGNQGDRAYDDSFLYIKTSAGWKRTALSTF